MKGADGAVDAQLRRNALVHVVEVEIEPAGQLPGERVVYKRVYAVGFGAPVPRAEGAASSAPRPVPF